MIHKGIFDVTRNHTISWCSHTPVNKQEEGEVIGQGNRCLKVYRIPKEIDVWAPLILPIILNTNNQLSNAEAECGEFKHFTIHQ